MQNSKTQTLLQSFTENPAASLIIEGNESTGAADVATNLAQDLLGNKKKGNLLTIDAADEKSIGIEIVRDLKKRMSTVAGREQPITRAVCIQQAERLTTEAQNALLKMIEEPAKNTLLILVVKDKSDLLRTIRSRCQTIKILPITKQQAVSYCESKSVDSVACNKAFLLSGGGFKVFEAIITDNDSEVTDNIKLAKEFLGQKQFDRLVRQKEFDKHKALTALVNSILIIAEAGLHSSPKKSSRRWQSVLKTARSSKDLLDKNTNVKLVFLRLSIMV